MHFIGKLQGLRNHIKDCGCPSQATNVGSIPNARSTSSAVRLRYLQMLSDEESRGMAQWVVVGFLQEKQWEWISGVQWGAS